MAREYTVSFFGHRHLGESWEIAVNRVTDVIRKLTQEHERLTVLVGRDGDFDLIVASVVRRAKQKSETCEISLTWVMAYLKSEYSRDPEAYEEYYDVVELCEECADVYPKQAIKRRNQIMIDRSDRVIVFVAETHGGAFQAMEYARINDKTLCNLALL